MDPQLENRMVNHLAVVVWQDNEVIRTVNVQDPFHHTKVTITAEWSLWDWFKMLLTRRWETELCVHVRSDGVSQGRWFQRAIICDNCKRNRIDNYHQPEHDCGYHHGDERWCESCYYAHPDQPSLMGVS